TTFKSDQRTNATAVPVVPNKYQDAGREYCQVATFTVPVATVAVNDLVELVTVPAGRRITWITVIAEAMSTERRTAGIDIGTASSAPRYLTNGNIDAAATIDAASTIAQNAGDVLTADTLLLARGQGEAWANGKKLIVLVWSLPGA